LFKENALLKLNKATASHGVLVLGYF